MPQISDKLSSVLNREQLDAVSCIEGPLLVLAGAGTGKTRVITYRIAHMLSSGISPENIAGMTFTNKAAREMRERLSQVVDKDSAEKVFLGTFHAFCARILRKEISTFGYTPSYTIADETDQTGILKQVLGEMGVQKGLVNIPYTLNLISRVKSELTTPQKINVKDAVLETLFPEIYKRYSQILKLQNMLDFDDLIYLTVKLLMEDEDVLEKYRDKYRYLLVDEYQDTNYLQFRMLELLAGERQNLCVVGDDDQSIYAWRGAKIENILNFPDKFNGTKQTKLEQNYRSTNIILKVSNSLISRNRERHEKSLWSERGEGRNIKFVEADSGEHEAYFIADAVMDFFGTKEVFSYNDIAVLYRSNHLSRLIENAFREARIPYRIVGGRSFYERKEVRDAVAYLKLLVNPRDDQSLLRIIATPPRGIGAKAIEKFKEFHMKTFLPLSQLIGNEECYGGLSSTASAGAAKLAECLSRWSDAVADGTDLGRKVYEFLKEVGYLDGLLRIYRDRDDADKRRGNVMELVNAVSQYEIKEGSAASLHGFIEMFCLADDNDKVEEEEQEAVTFMTVHAAKGLEFPAVFIMALEDGIFPNERALDDGSIEEERRLFYVAITRARDILMMSRARERMKFGMTSFQKPTRFLSELPLEYVEVMDVKDVFKKVTPEALQAALDNFTF